MMQPDIGIFEMMKKKRSFKQQRESQQEQQRRGQDIVTYNGLVSCNTEQKDADHLQCASI
jgi:hypothetical protein